MKLIDLVKAEGVVESLADKDLDVSLSYKLMKFISGASDEIEFFRKERQNIIVKYAKKDDNGNVITDDKGQALLQEDKVKEVDEEFQKLFDTEVEEPKITFKLSELEDLKISAVNLLSLEKFIKEE